ncbi:MAG: sporulation protein YabP [Candidatus Cellulosilyticum pullistercoris]|uniref:Sporulation protein YabP n=1 Tax=Candidatus Cellulosilyticum pullistercoris TaxID=2838521 RepID=A0A9E2NMB2_9FIRM|nr:sporulation protein YabP [Candidatus Cellulosilyticum pullistercoris]
MDEKTGKKHTLSLIERERLTLSGVKEVFSFDETLIELETSKGYLDIGGEDLHIIKMNIDDGDIIIEGSISDMNYHDNQGAGKKKGSVMSKLFK